MLEKTLPLLVLCLLPTIVVSQPPSITPQGAAPSRPFGPTAESEEKQRQSVEQLQQLVESPESLTKEIQRLRKLTGKHEQVVVSVKVCELSLTKAQNVVFNVGDIDAKSLRPNGFGATLSAGDLDAPAQAFDIKQSDNLRESVCIRVIENDATLKKVVAELEKSGALKVLTESTLVTVSGRPASLHIGGEFPTPVAQRSGDSAIEFKAFGTQLYLAPEVLSQKRIRLEVRPTISEIDPSHSVKMGDVTVPGLRVRGVSTSVEMGDGQTFVLAGLVQRRPILKAREKLDLPSEAPEPSSSQQSDDNNDDPCQNETEETELIVMFRPEIVEAL
ncbi:hypothetical protein [Bremerella alba]|uniref:Type II/III secretion system secretin-like domain-containing protein n=1 Tax=Bremerella alba TaxID=980252 RepID=A0A7V8V6I7_9BACT|nr:hypothetical protein [Bremerella alba]MBA2115646.1 hypothetical protein [Bremerella alba]